MNTTCERDRQIRMCITLIIALIVSIAPGGVSARTNDLISSQVATIEAEAAYGQVPLHFEANQGQVEAGQVRYISRGAGYTIYLTPTGFSLDMIRPDQGVAVKAELVGGNPDPPMIGLDQLPGRSHYFSGTDPTRWRTDIPNFERVQYRAVWPGIDAIFYGHQRLLEYDFVVAPGADPGQIGLSFAGVEPQLAGNGDLLLLSAGEEVLRLQAPGIYQEQDGRRQRVEGGFVVDREQVVSFWLGQYDPDLPLFIDPLIYSTFLGGSGDDYSWYSGSGGLAVDSNGNAYVTGRTSSADFPATPGAYDPTPNGNYDVFVTKLNPAGAAVVYTTYLGGSGHDVAYDLAVDSSGNAYVTGWTYSPNFPTTPGTYDPTLGSSGKDVFIAKLNPAGAALVYSTYLGSSNQSDEGHDIAVDSSGNAYVTGSTGSTVFPTTAGAFDPTFNGGTDIFVTKLNPAGTALVYSTYLGGSGAIGEDAFGLAVDSSGQAYVTGYTGATNFPTTAGAYDPTYNGGYDVFVSQLNPAGSALVYSTYLGGSDPDYGYGLAVDSSGSAYVARASGRVTRLTPDGAGLVYSTYLGGLAIHSVAVDSAGNAYVTGYTDAADFPITPGADDPTYNGGGADAFVSKLNPDGSVLVYSTFLGGSGHDSGWDLAVDSEVNVYVTGRTNSADFPTPAGGYDPSYNGSYDVFVTKLTTDLTPPTNPTTVVETGGANDNTWQNSVSDPAFSWSGADDDISGVAGYYWCFSTSPTCTPDTWTDTPTADPAAPGEGTFYLRVQTEDGASNQSSPTTLFTFNYENTAPTNPTAVVETGGATDNTWQNTVADPAFTWSGADDDITGVAGYYWCFSTSPTCTPDTWTDTPTADPAAPGEGTYYLRVLTEDDAGNQSSPVILFTFKYDNSDGDGDGLLDIDENLDGDGDLANDDSDGDGTPNYLDPDDDGDGILTGNEDPDNNGDPTGDDTDDDGTPDYLDSDDDGDGIRTRYEQPDSNGDGQPDDALNTDGDSLPNYLDPNDDNDSRPTVGENTDPNGDGNPADALDTDGDGSPDYLDERDGAPWGDDDGDGLSNEVECPATPCVDTDADGIPDSQDLDSDGDGLLDQYEYDHNGDGTMDDSDRDGRPDFRDTDDDGDGKLTRLEQADPDGDGNPADAIDRDTDGIPDYLDPLDGWWSDWSDFDSDGLSNDLECPGWPPCVDTDGDGVADWVDLDSDDDGLSDGEEGGFDPDGDGVPGYRDPDDDGDTVPTRLENLDGDEEWLDDNTDGDFQPNYRDPDDDGDGIPTRDEDPNGNGDPTDDDTDGDGIPDYLDADDDGPDSGDSDGDGIPDATECPTGVPCLDTDGDGQPDYMESGDSDGDGLLDRYEYDRNEDGLPDDTDGDGAPDYRDNDDDGDDRFTAEEHPDLNGDGNPADALDTDGDGLPDYLDPDQDSEPGHIYLPLILK